MRKFSYKDNDFFFEKKELKNLVHSKKSSNFALANEGNPS